jgi:putative ABC transport system permease protein
MTGLFQDVRYAIRQLRKSPGFTTVAVLTLALGIGATTGIFSIVNGVLLRPLQYRQPQQLYLIREIVPELSQTYPTLPVNLLNFRVWQRECRAFEDIAIVKASDSTLTGDTGAEQVFGGQASANIFSLLGVAPELGRTFLPQEDAPGKNFVVVLTNSFWHNRFHSDPAIVGKTINLDGVPFQVIGVLPASFHFPRGAQLGDLAEFPSHMDYFKPLGLNEANFSPLGDFDFAAIARLKHGVSTGQALAELNVIQARIATNAKQGLGLRAEIVPLETQVIGAARRGLLLLLAGVGAVLLIVCVNLAVLSLMRLPGRLREMAIRNALGASRGRVVRQLLTESGLLAGLGGSLGLGFSYFGLRSLIAMAPADLPRMNEVHVDGRVLLFALAITILTAMLFGALPAWRAAYSQSQESLKAGAKTITDSARSRRLRDVLIGFEVCIGTILLIVAGLLTTSMVRLLGVDKGFTPERVLTTDVNLPPHLYTKPEQKERFYGDVLTRVQAIPGVSYAGWISKLPLEGQEQVDEIHVPGRSIDKANLPIANYRYVTPDYFQAMSIPLRQGRKIDPTDRDRHVAIIAESVAKRLWPGEKALGKEFRPGDADKPLTEVIGVVSDIRAVALDESPLMIVYLPAWPGSRNWSQSWDGMHASLVVRGTLDAASLASMVRSAIRDVDSGVPIVRLRTMSELVSESVSARRFQMDLVSLFSIFALLLAALGIYGVAGYSVAQRRHELGIRMALGARGSDLQNLVLSQGMVPVITGWAVGLLTAFLAGNILRSLLFDVTARDPRTVGIVSLVVLITALLACYLPARRAAKVDPMVALRYE